MRPPEPGVLAERFIEVIQRDILPRTREEVAAGSYQAGKDRSAIPLS